MKIHQPHRWKLSYHDALALQNKLAKKVRLRPLSLRKIRYVAGADIAIDKKRDRLIAAVVVLDFPSLERVETRFATAKTVFPYIPGLLSFREIPVLIRCIQRIRTRFDVLLCDGQGIAHPRGFGLASHLGVLLRTPTIGCAKNRLVGEHDATGRRRGDFSRLVLGTRYIGSVLRTQDDIKPLFVSPGHLIDHPSSRHITLACGTRFRLPEPTRWADRFAGEEKRRLQQRVS